MGDGERALSPNPQPATPNPRNPTFVPAANPTFCSSAISSISGKQARTSAALSSREPFSTTTTRNGSAQLRSDSRQPRSSSHVLKETITMPIEVIAAASVAGVVKMRKRRLHACPSRHNIFRYILDLIEHQAAMQE